MASYFVASRARPGGVHAVHDRGRCPPDCFPQGASEYLGEYGQAAQAIVVARTVYAGAVPCACCDPAAAPAPRFAPPLTLPRP